MTINRDDVIRMATEAGMNLTPAQFSGVLEDEVTEVQLERFATLVAAKERAARITAQTDLVYLKERIARAGVEHRRAVREAVLEEREACAQICDELVSAPKCAAAIRARGAA